MNYKTIILSALITGTNVCMGMQNQNAQFPGATAPFVTPTNSIRGSYQPDMLQNPSAPVMSQSQANSLDRLPAYQQPHASNTSIREIAALTQAIHAYNTGFAVNGQIAQRINGDISKSESHKLESCSACKKSFGPMDPQMIVPDCSQSFHVQCVHHCIITPHTITIEILNHKN